MIRKNPAYDTGTPAGCINIHADMRSQQSMIDDYYERRSHSNTTQRGKLAKAIGEAGAPLPLAPMSDHAMDLLLSQASDNNSAKRSRRQLGRKVERDILARLATPPQATLPASEARTDWESLYKRLVGALEQHARTIQYSPYIEVNNDWYAIELRKILQENT